MLRKTILFLATFLIVLQFGSTAGAVNCHIKPGAARLSTFCILYNIPQNHRFTREELIGLSTRMYKIGQPPFVKPGSDLLEEEYDRFDGSFYVSPIVDYLSNLNGGNPKDKSFLQTNLIETSDPLFDAKSGPIYGTVVGTSGNAVVREGSYLESSWNFRYSYNPNHRLPLINSSANLCNYNHIGNWWYIEPCANGNYSKRRLTENASTNLKLGLSKYFASTLGAYHKAKIGYIRHIADDMSDRRLPSDYEQDRIEFILDTIHLTNFYTSFSAVLGANVKKDRDSNDLKFDRPATTPVTKRYLSATFGTIILERPYSITLQFNDTDNILVSGSNRYDRTFSAYMSYRPWNFLSFGLGYVKTNSTYRTDYYDSSEYLYDLNFYPISF